MSMAITILAWIFILMGGAVALRWFQIRHTEYIAGAGCYLIAGIVALKTESWIALAVGFALALVVRTIFRRLGWGSDQAAVCPPSITRIAAILSDANTSLETEREALDALVGYMRQVPELNNTLEDFSISDERVRRMYGALVSAGAGQWAGKYWIPVSTLVEEDTLRYLVEAWEGDDLTDSVLPEAQGGYRAAGCIVSYFQYGEPLSQ